LVSSATVSAEGTKPDVLHGFKPMPGNGCLDANASFQGADVASLKEVS